MYKNNSRWLVPKILALILGFVLVLTVAYGVTQAANAHADDVAELQAAQAQYGQAIEKVNSANPMSADYGKKLHPGDRMPAGFESLQKIQSLLDNAIIRRMLKLYSNSSFVTAVGKIAEHPMRNQLIYCEIGALVFFIILRAWRQSKSKSWYGKLWVSVYSFSLLSLVAALILPYAILGDSYKQVARGVYKAVVG